MPPRHPPRYAPLRRCHLATPHKGERAVYEFDYFISFPSSEAGFAERLDAALVRRLTGQRVYFHPRSGVAFAGLRWGRQLERAVAASWSMVVVVGDKSEEAYFARAEVLRGIEQLRESEKVDDSAMARRVIPVPVRGKFLTSAELPFELEQLNALVPTTPGDVEELAIVLASLVPRQPVVPAPSVEGAAATAGEALSAKFRLDRSTQWMRLVDLCRDDKSRTIAVTADRRQRLDRFLERTTRFLAAACGRRHRIHRVVYRVETSRAPTPGEWWRRFESALRKDEATPMPRSDEDGLAAAGGDALTPGVLFLLAVPFDAAFEPAHASSLATFLGGELPAQLKEHGLTGPARVLVALDHTAAKRGRADLVADALIQAERLPGAWPLSVLPRLVTPGREDVEDYLLNLNVQGKRLTPRDPRFIAILDGYDELVADNVGFDELADYLDRRLSEMEDPSMKWPPSQG